MFLEVDTIDVEVPEEPSERIRYGRHLTMIVLVRACPGARLSAPSRNETEGIRLDSGRRSLSSPRPTTLRVGDSAECLPRRLCCSVRSALEEHARPPPTWEPKGQVEACLPGPVGTFRRERRAVAAPTRASGGNSTVVGF
jgi:hypothetical protein